MNGFDMALQAIQGFRDAGGLSMETTRTHDLDQFRIAATAKATAVSCVVSELILECQVRHGVSSGLVPCLRTVCLPVRHQNDAETRRTTIVVNAYTVAAYPVLGFENPLKRHVVASACAFASLFDRIMALADGRNGFANVPTSLTKPLLETMSAFAASHDAWAVFDTRRLVERTKRTLSALYSALARGELLGLIDAQIVGLRTQMVKMDHTQKGFLAVEEMRRMLRVVKQAPVVMRAFVSAQSRVRLVWGIRESRAVRGKLAAFRQILDTRCICYEIFAMIAQRVLTSTGGQ